LVIRSPIFPFSDDKKWNCRAAPSPPPFSMTWYFRVRSRFPSTVLAQLLTRRFPFLILCTFIIPPKYETFMMPPHSFFSLFCLRVMRPPPRCRVMPFFFLLRGIVASVPQSFLRLQPQMVIGATVSGEFSLQHPLPIFSCQVFINKPFLLLPFQDFFGPCPQM